MLAKKQWKLSNICVINISVNNNFIGVGQLIPTKKS